jgi:hypothetical protein
VDPTLEFKFLYLMADAEKASEMYFISSKQKLKVNFTLKQAI